MLFYFIGKDGQSQVDREERLRILREKQNEERQRKLDELKQQVNACYFKLNNH